MTRNTSALRRICAIAGATLAGTAAALVMAGPASAHHTTVSGKAACADSGGYLITWTVTNSEKDKIATITAVTATPNTAVSLKVNDEIAADGVARVTQTVPLGTRSATLTVSALWKKTNATSTNDGTVTNFPTGCTPPAEKVAKPSASFATACDGIVTVTLKNGADAERPADFTVTGKDGWTAKKTVAIGATDDSIKVPAANSAEIKVTEGPDNTAVATGKREVAADCGALPLTGVKLTAAVGGALALLGAGTAMFFVARRRKVRFTAA